MSEGFENRLQKNTHSHPESDQKSNQTEPGSVGGVEDHFEGEEMQNF